MKLEDFSIESLIGIITGDSIPQIGIYRTGEELVRLFNEFGFKDNYGTQFTSRKSYVRDKLPKINGNKNMDKLVLRLVDERNFIGTTIAIDKTAEEINKIIKHDNYQLKKYEDGYRVEGCGVEEGVVVEPKFQDIQKDIINEIRKAKYTIWVAVAWFTDPILYEELKKKKEQGLNVRVIISNDEINLKSGLDYSIFQTYKMNKFGEYGYNMMHNKFCIIDFKTVLEGSYNWTKSAEYHKEQFTKLSGYSCAEQFLDRFMQLINEIEINSLFEF